MFGATNGSGREEALEETSRDQPAASIEMHAVRMQSPSLLSPNLIERFAHNDGPEGVAIERQQSEGGQRLARLSQKLGL